MDKIIIEKFYKELLQKDNLKSAQSIRNMLKELPEYLRDRIYEKYKKMYRPFSQIIKYRYCCILEGAPISNNQKIEIGIWCGENGYELILHGIDGNLSEDDFEKLKQSATTFQKFQKTEEPNEYSSHFSFFEEDKLYEFIDKILEELKSLRK
ncbi:MAG: hypothetical protein K6F29_04145 [Bacteroidales bacterium]|nr:hypothetical protein [Bacteroidales bacterium]